MRWCLARLRGLVQSFSDQQRLCHQEISIPSDKQLLHSGCSLWRYELCVSVSCWLNDCSYSMQVDSLASSQQLRSVQPAASCFILLSASFLCSLWRHELVVDAMSRCYAGTPHPGAGGRWSGDLDAWRLAARILATQLVLLSALVLVVMVVWLEMKNVSNGTCCVISESLVSNTAATVQNFYLAATVLVMKG